MADLRNASPASMPFSVFLWNALVKDWRGLVAWMLFNVFVASRLFSPRAYLIWCFISGFFVRQSIRVVRQMARQLRQMWATRDE